MKSFFLQLPVVQRSPREKLLDQNAWQSISNVQFTRKEIERRLALIRSLLLNELFVFYIGKKRTDIDFLPNEITLGDPHTCILI